MNKVKLSKEEELLKSLIDRVILLRENQKKDGSLYNVGYETALNHIEDWIGEQTK